jgi:hypothetical protein
LAQTWQQKSFIQNEVFSFLFWHLNLAQAKFSNLPVSWTRQPAENLQITSVSDFLLASLSRWKRVGAEQSLTQMYLDDLAIFSAMVDNGPGACFIQRRFKCMEQCIGRMWRQKYFYQQISTHSN